jgi:hypothetical protein
MNLNQLTPGMISLGTKLQQSVPNPFYKIITTGPNAAATVPVAYLLTAAAVHGGRQHVPDRRVQRARRPALKVEKRMSHGLTMLASFTGQKLIDDFSILSNVGTARAECRTSTTGGASGLCHRTTGRGGL